MDKAQMFPFVRNRYYNGKMLTSGDFQTEQRYFNTKRAFINQMTLGAGIICGLRVYNLDDLSILIESGAAIDQEGREIVAEESVVCKLSALEGYEGANAQVLSLYIRYREEEIQPVYAGGLGDSLREYENNRISEGYELFLKNAAEQKESFSLDSEFFVEVPILKSEEIEISLRMPACACKGKKVKLEVAAKNRTGKSGEFELDMMIRLPVFIAEDGSHSLHISLQEESLEKESMWEYWIYTEMCELSETHILLDEEDGEVIFAGYQRRLDSNISLTVRLDKESPEALVRKQLGRTSLDIYSSGGRQDGIHLADIHMLQTPAAYVIDFVEETGADTYVTLPAREEERRRYLSFYEEGEFAEPEPQENLEQMILEKEQTEAAPVFINGGMLTIPLEKRMKKGNICFSQETVHGLGSGRVYVAVGAADTGEMAGAYREAETTIFGNMSLFAERDMEMTCIETAVKVFHDRGSFQVAARLQGEQHTVLLNIPWIAVRVPDDEAIIEEPQDGQIIPLTPTWRMKPKEKHFFEIQFKNMKECVLHYAVMDEDGGVIDEDGIYTAPAKPGVYEIHISTAGHRNIGTYVYAVVERETVV